MKRAILIALLLIGAVALTVRAEDTRERVELPPPMQAHLLANMRDHLLGFSGGEHTTWRKAASDAGCSEIGKFGVCLRAGGLAGVPGNGQNPLG
jgi:hypothetical protein